MKIYVFGNEDVANDRSAIVVSDKLKSEFPNITFIPVKPNEDLPFADENNVILLDTVQGIDAVTLIEDKDLEKLVLPPRGSVHDFDLGFQLKYLKKIGKLGKVTIIGLPQEGDLDYLRIHSILRKLVAQDMQGS